jgi:predicted O-methyltransferase YrrM
MDYSRLTVCLLAALVLVLVLAVEFRRRRMNAASLPRLQLLAGLDLLAPAATAAAAIFFAGRLYPEAVASGVVSLRSPMLLSMLLCIVFLPVFWAEGKKQIQFQRPTGLLFAEWLFFLGAGALLSAFLMQSALSQWRPPSVIAGAALLLVSLLIITRIVPPFTRKYEGLRILDRVAEEDQFAQPEYTPPTPECPHPELWHMLDSQTTEVEVLDFLRSLVITTKPGLIVETGTFLGHGTLKLAEGARENGFGRVITIEFDSDIRDRALIRFESSGLSPWIESRLESSLDTVIEGTIDLLYSDSHLANREAEIRRLLPQLDPRGLLVIHDASSHFKVVREAALRLEAEGLISTVLLSTPRGVVIAQRREGRA